MGSSSSKGKLQVSDEGCVRERLEECISART